MLKTSVFPLAASILITSASWMPLIAKDDAGIRGDAPAGESDYIKSKALLKKKGRSNHDLERAFELMKISADQGNADALGMLGYFYAEGLTVQKDRDKAMEYFRMGAEKGSAASQLNLGLLLADEAAPEAQKAEALSWIAASAKQGLPDGLAALSECIYLGKLSLKRDYAEVLRHAEAAAQSGHPKALNMLGVLYQHGHGVEKDPEAAERWFRQAAEKGYALAQSNLAHLIGFHRPDRRVEALKWLMLASRNGEIRASKTIDQIRPALPRDVLFEAEKLADDIAQ